jgi:hypothetical protein
MSNLISKNMGINSGISKGDTQSMFLADNWLKTGSVLNQGLVPA